MKNVPVEAIKSVGNLLCKTGRVNAYRKAFLQGYGGSSKEETWHPLGKTTRPGFHSCCLSKQCWRHHAKCPRVRGELQSQPSQPYKNDATLLQVKKYKDEGKNSGEIARLMGVPLERINRLFVEA